MPCDEFAKIWMISIIERESITFFGDSQPYGVAEGTRERNLPRSLSVRIVKERAVPLFIVILSCPAKC